MASQTYSGALPNRLESLLGGTQSRVLLMPTAAVAVYGGIGQAGMVRFTCEAVAGSVLHDKAQVLVCEDDFFGLYDVHVPLAQLRLNLGVSRTDALSETCLWGM